MSAGGAGRGIEVVSRSPDETEALAEALGRTLRGGEVLLLVGELGAGKTRFTRGLARGLGIDPRQVKSPSYNILHQYDGGARTLQHFDAYFVREDEEYRRAGLDDFLASGDVVVVEWGDRHATEFPPDALRVAFAATDETTRTITVTQDRETDLMTRIGRALREARA